MQETTDITLTPERNKTGRKTRTVEHANATQILEGSAIAAARIVSDLVKGTRKRISRERYMAVIFNIEQCLGKARQKVEHSGGILTYSTLVKSAENLEKNGPELLIDADKVGKN